MTRLRAVSAQTITRAIAGAAERWTDADFPPRVRLLDRIGDRTGYTVPVVEYALDRLFGSMTEPALQAVIAGELGSIAALEGFVTRPGRPTAWASPVGRVCIISSRTTIGVAIPAAVFALCAKCDVLVKDREDALVSAFFETLVDELDEFADSARARIWSANDGHAAELAQFDAIVAFGSDETLREISARVRPGARFIGYGSRASAGYIGREALANETALRALLHGAARDLLLYETQGCLSLHVLFIERGGGIEPSAVCELFNRVLETVNVEFPPGHMPAATAARIAQHRNLAAFRAASGSGTLYGDANAAYAVVLDPPVSEPPPFLPRTLGIIPVDDCAQALAYLRTHTLPLEGFAISPVRPDVVQLAIDAGAVWLTRFGELQQPPLGTDHGGRPRIAEFVRWIDKTL